MKDARWIDRDGKKRNMPCIAVIALEFKIKSHMTLRQREEKLRNPER